MAGGNLTYAEWAKLSEEKRGERYKDLSAQDKFRVRITMNPGAKSVRCNDCRYYRGCAKCDAYPNRIPSEQLDAVDVDPSTPCGNGLHYEEA